MRRAVRTVTAIVFTVIILGCGFAVLYLGTSTGLTFGGAGSELGQSSLGKPVYAQVGWLRNTAPWPITVQSITTNAVNASNNPLVYLERVQSGPRVSSGPLPNWALNASRAPYQLDGGALRFLGFALEPRGGQVRPSPPQPRMCRPEFSRTIRRPTLPRSTLISRRFAPCCSRAADTTSRLLWATARRPRTGMPS